MWIHMVYIWYMMCVMSVEHSLYDIVCVWYRDKYMWCPGCDLGASYMVGGCVCSVLCGIV